MSNLASLSSLTFYFDPASGGIRFGPYVPPTVSATGFAVLGIEQAGLLPSLEVSVRKSLIEFLRRHEQFDGTFTDPLLNERPNVSREHGREYVEQECSVLARQALDALQETVRVRSAYPFERNPSGIRAYFDSFGWRNPWMDSNRVMFALSDLCHDDEVTGGAENAKTIDAALDWLDEHQSEETGMWVGPHNVDIENAMAATFHFTFFYYHRNRPLRYLNQIIDSCLALESVHGLFCRYQVGHTCLDYDAMDLLAKASQETTHRRAEVQACAARTFAAIDSLRNPDGGYAHAKWRVYARHGRYARWVRKVGLGSLLPNVKIPLEGLHEVVWECLRTRPQDSNPQATWFRSLTADLSRELLGQVTTGRFRRLPFLGYHRSVTGVQSPVCTRQVVGMVN